MINWTLSDTKRRLKVDIGVALGTEPQSVLDLMAEADDEHSEILKDPKPRPRFLGFGDSSLDFQLLYWIPDFDEGFRLGTEMTLAVHNKIIGAGITIPYPQRDLHVKSSEGSPPPQIEALLKSDEAKRSRQQSTTKEKKPAVNVETAKSKEGFDIDGE